MTQDDTDELPAHVVPMARLRYLYDQTSLSLEADLEHSLLVNWLASYSTIQRRCAKLNPEAFMDCLPRPDGSTYLDSRHTKTTRC